MAGITPYTDESWRKTNADRIRAMTDEELAEFLGENDSNFPIGDHKKEWLSWLKQETE